MKLTYSPHPCQWHDGNQHHVGVMVLGEWEDGNPIAVTNNGRGYVSHLQSDDLVQVAHSHTRELEFVEYGKLSPYPSEPIPQPTNEGRGY